MDSISLMGAEQVQNAGRVIAQAAETMRFAASNMHEALLHHQRFLDDWLQRLDDTIGRGLPIVDRVQNNDGQPTTDVRIPIVDGKPRT